MVKLPKGDEEPDGLNWLWRPEPVERLRNGSVRGSKFTMNELQDQRQ